MYLSPPYLPPAPFYHFFPGRRKMLTDSHLQRFVTFIFLLSGALR